MPGQSEPTLRTDDSFDEWGRPITGPQYHTWTWGHWLLWIFSWLGILITRWRSHGTEGGDLRPYDPDGEAEYGPLTMPNMERPPDEPRGYPTRFDM